MATTRSKARRAQEPGIQGVDWDAVREALGEVSDACIPPNAITIYGIKDELKVSYSTASKHFRSLIDSGKYALGYARLNGKRTKYLIPT